MGPTWGHLGPTGPRWAPCWLHESCYLGYLISPAAWEYVTREDKNGKSPQQWATQIYLRKTKYYSMDILLTNIKFWFTDAVLIWWSNKRRKNGIWDGLFTFYLMLSTIRIRNHLYLGVLVYTPCVPKWVFTDGDNIETFMMIFYSLCMSLLLFLLKHLCSGHNIAALLYKFFVGRKCDIICGS